MTKLHAHLKTSHKMYSDWHKHTNFELTHWASFIAVAFVLTSIILSDASDIYAINNALPVKVSSAAPKVLPLAAIKREPASDHILVKFKPSLSNSKRQDIYHRHNISDISQLPHIGVSVLRISENDTPEEVIDRMKFQDGNDIEFAEVDEVLPPEFIPTDPYYSSEWHLAKVEAAEAWDMASANPGVAIAILDTGVDCTHPDLFAACTPGWNFYDNNSDTRDVYGHGTAVAGTALAITNNSIGVSSLGGGASLVPIRVSDTTGGGYTSMIANGLIWAADHNARVANISYKVGGSSTIGSAATYFASKGGVVTTSAGNYGSVHITPDHPALITVSATNAADGVTSWSDTGSDIDIAAPGEGIWTTTNTIGNTTGYVYSSMSGTSFSAPMVAGLAALVIAANPTINSDQIQNVIKQSAVDLGSSGWDPHYGWGRINAYRAVSLACSYAGSLCNPGTPLPTVSPTPMVTIAPTITPVVTPVIPTPTASPTVTPTGIPTPTVSPTATPALKPVVISSFSVTKKTASSAIITWTTNVPSIGTVNFGLTSAGLYNVANDGIMSTIHSITLNNLTKATKYYYQITSQASGYLDGKSAVSTFKTNAK